MYIHIWYLLYIQYTVYLNRNAIHYRSSFSLNSLCLAYGCLWCRTSQNFILSESATRLLIPFFMNLLKRFDEKIKPILKIYQLWVRVYKWRPVLIFDQRMCANFLLDVPHCVAGRNVEPYFYYFITFLCFIVAFS